MRLIIPVAQGLYGSTKASPLPQTGSSVIHAAAAPDASINTDKLVMGTSYGWEELGAWGGEGIK